MIRYLKHNQKFVKYLGQSSITALFHRTNKKSQSSLNPKVNQTKIKFANNVNQLRSQAQKKLNYRSMHLYLRQNSRFNNSYNTKIKLFRFEQFTKHLQKLKPTMYIVDEKQKQLQDPYKKLIILMGIFLGIMTFISFVFLVKFIKNLQKEKQIYSKLQQHKKGDQLQISDMVFHIINQQYKQYHLQIIYENGTKDFITKCSIDPSLILAEVQNINNSSHRKINIQTTLQQEQVVDSILKANRFLVVFIPLAIVIAIFRISSPDKLISRISGKTSKSSITSIKQINVKFKDVAGMQQAKKQITQFVDFLKYSDKYREIGAKIPKGALLTGPPGTGKTMLAKACAGQAGVAFFYIPGSEFVQMFVGVGASKVRQLFAKARQQSPSIIFIDQIDTIGKKRQSSSNQQSDATLNQLLVEMDGFSSRETIVVLAATNRKEVLDSALTRPGRFDRTIEIILPDIKARQEIFMVHLKPLKIDPSRQLSQIAKRLAELSPGFSGADIANLCNQAALIAARKRQQFITDKDFEDASERVTAGYVKKSLSSAKTRKRVALHEAGHAVASWFLKGGDPLVKLTIIPRSKGALGYAQYLPKSSHMKTKQDLIDRIAILLGGLTSEQCFYKNISSGGSDDLQKVYQVTRAMISSYGMGESTYNVTLDEQTTIKKQSDYLTNIMDDEIKKVLQIGKARVKNIIEQKKQLVQKLAEELITKQTINTKQIIEILGQRPKFDQL